MDKLEKVYKEKIYDFQSEVSNSVWTNISASLDRNKRNRRIIVFMIVLTVLSLLLSGIYYLMLSSNKSVTPKNEKTSILAVTGNERSFNNISTPNHEYAKIDEKQLNGQSKDYFSDQRNLSSLFSNPGSSGLSSKEFLFPEELMINTVNSNTKYEIENIPVLPLKFSSVPGYKPNITKYFHKNKSESQTIYHKRRGILDDCFPSKINSWLLEAYASPVYSVKSLKGENEVLINSRRNSENPLLSYSSGIRIGYNYKGAVLKSGVDYTSINEKFRIILKNVISTQTIITIDTIKNSDGTFTITRDTTIKEIYGEKDIKKFNSYRMLGIPLIIGYELKYQRHSFGLNAGVIINILLRKSGSILNKDGKITNLVDEGDEVFVTRTGASLFSSLFYAYSINDKFAVFAEPVFTYSLFPITKKEYDLKQKYFTYGISFGGRYLF
jgi:hypothetical protein